VRPLKVVGISCFPKDKMFHITYCTVNLEATLVPDHWNSTESGVPWYTPARVELEERTREGKLGRLHFWTLELKKIVPVLGRSATNDKSDKQSKNHF